jgi:hypothetical protein
MHWFEALFASRGSSRTRKVPNGKLELALARRASAADYKYTRKSRDVTQEAKHTTKRAIMFGRQSLHCASQLGMIMVSES